MHSEASGVQGLGEIESVQKSAQIFGIKKRISITKQGDRSVMEYVNVLKGLWRELDHYQCLRMKYGEDVVLLKQFVEKERIFEFLIGLNVKYDQKRSQILDRDELPSLDETIAMIIAEEVPLDYRQHGSHMNRPLKAICASMENVIVRKRADVLIRLINSPYCPKSISIQMFAQKAVTQIANLRMKSSSDVFAFCRVIILVTSKIPLAMDTLIAELNRACIYTVPKHISYSAENFLTKDAYYKAIGYEEKDGKIESSDSYLNKLNAYMRLYGALVQFDEVDGFQNLHGPKEGLAWLAKFWNTVPANRYTANALHSFLEMAGFGLYQRYKTRFEKLLHFIARDFLSSLKEGNPELEKPMSGIRDYAESEKFKKEPDGLKLKSSTESSYHFGTQAFALLGNWCEENGREWRKSAGVV